MTFTREIRDDPTGKLSGQINEKIAFIRSIKELLYYGIYKRSELSSWLSESATEVDRHGWQQFNTTIETIFFPRGYTSEAMAVSLQSSFYFSNNKTKMLLEKLFSYLNNEALFNSKQGLLKDELMTFYHALAAAIENKKAHLNKDGMLTLAERIELRTASNVILSIIENQLRVIDHVYPDDDPELRLNAKIKNLIKKICSHIKRVSGNELQVEGQVACIYYWNRWRAGIAQLAVEGESIILEDLLKLKPDLRRMLLAYKQRLTSLQQGFLEYMRGKAIALPTPIAPDEGVKMASDKVVANELYRAKTAHIRHMLLFRREHSLDNYYKRALERYRYYKEGIQSEYIARACNVLIAKLKADPDNEKEDFDPYIRKDACESALIGFLHGAKELHIPSMLKVAEMISNGEGCAKNPDHAGNFLIYAYIHGKDEETKRQSFALLKEMYLELLDGFDVQPVKLNSIEIMIIKTHAMLEGLLDMVMKDSQPGRLLEYGKVCLALFQIEQDYHRTGHGSACHPRGYNLKRACEYFMQAHNCNVALQQYVKNEIITQFCAVQPSVFDDVCKNIQLGFLQQLNIDTSRINPIALNW